MDELLEWYAYQHPANTTGAAIAPWVLAQVMAPRVMPSHN